MTQKLVSDCRMLNSADLICIGLIKVMSFPFFFIKDPKFGTAPTGQLFTEFYLESGFLNECLCSSVVNHKIN